MKSKLPLLYGILLLGLILPVACFLETLTFRVDPVNPTDQLTQPLAAAFAPSPQESWTLMLYLDGAVDLEPEALTDFKELELGLWQLLQKDPGLDDCFNIIILFDRIAGYSTDPAGDWVDTRLYRTRPSAALHDPFASEQLYDPGGSFGFATAPGAGVERNMAHPDTLRNFVDYVTTHYVSDHYVLVLWDHGDGPRSDSSGAVVRSIAADDELPTRDSLSIEELQRALAATAYVSSGSRLDIVGFDACLMGSVEIAYELRGVTDFMVASMANEYDGGWDYRRLLDEMTPAGSSAGARELATLMVQSYAGSAGSYSSVHTLAAVALEGMAELKSTIDELAVAMYRENRQKELQALRDEAYSFYDSSNPWEARHYPYHDLNDFCAGILGNSDFFSTRLGDAAAAVLAQLGQVVVAAFAGETYGNYLAPGAVVKRGLFWVFPLGDRMLAPDNPVSYYADANWYTSVLLQSAGADASFMGQLDFCTFNHNGIVESWTELLQAWYDPDSRLIPWNDF